jgi:hypothetical protein
MVYLLGKNFGSAPGTATLLKKLAHTDGQAHTIRMGKAPVVRPILQEIGMM